MGRVTGAVYICGGEVGTDRVRDRRNDCEGCPSHLHDWPLPQGYVDASVEAGWRLRNGWRQRISSSSKSGRVIPAGISLGR